jgi:hypothetical protein
VVGRSAHERCGGDFACSPLGDGLLPTELFFSPIHLGLRDLSGSNQRRDACVGQLIAVLAHAVFQTFRFEAPLMAILLVVSTMFDVLVSSLRRASTYDESDGSYQSNGIVLHQ